MNLIGEHTDYNLRSGASSGHRSGLLRGLRAKSRRHRCASIPRTFASSREWPLDSIAGLRPLRRLDRLRDRRRPPDPTRPRTRLADPQHGSAGIRPQLFRCARSIAIALALGWRAMSRASSWPNSPSAPKTNSSACRRASWINMLCLRQTRRGDPDRLPQPRERVGCFAAGCRDCGRELDGEARAGAIRLPGTGWPNAWRRRAKSTWKACATRGREQLNLIRDPVALKRGAAHTEREPTGPRFRGSRAACRLAGDGPFIGGISSEPGARL